MDDDVPEQDGDDGSDPVEDIFAIIDRYYEGLKREDEGMGAD